MNVEEFLKDHHVQFRLVHFEETGPTAQHRAQTLHVPGDMMAKSVVLKVDGKYVLAVLPATHKVDVDKARQVLHADDVALAAEDEIKKLFPDCDLGSIPPFGSSYGLTTLFDEPLTGDEYVVFEGNHHDEIFCVRERDLEQIEDFEVADFSCHV